MNSRIGLKFYPENLDAGVLKAIAGKVDFVEVLALRGHAPASLDFLKDSGLEVTVHNMHFHQGVNLSNPARVRENRESLALSMGMADYFGSPVIVAHPGEKEEGSSTESAVKAFRDTGDSRLLVENMPFKDGQEFFCRTPEEVGRFMKGAGCGFCLDIGHATAAAAGLGLDYMEHIKGFLKLEPRYFHLQDTALGSARDMHLHFGEGWMDLPAVFRLLPKKARLCIETAVDIEGRLKDIMFLRENV